MNPTNNKTNASARVKTFFKAGKTHFKDARKNQANRTPTKDLVQMLKERLLGKKNADVEQKEQPQIHRDDYSGGGNYGAG
jgi:hypothetical protein